MKIYRRIEKILLAIINCFWISFIKIHEQKNINKKRKLYKQVKLSKNQKKQIDEFYKRNYGKKISYKWHRLYTSYTGKFDYKYVPDYIFSTKIEQLGNKRNNVIHFENKNLIYSLFYGVSEYIDIPKTYFMKVDGTFFDERFEPTLKAVCIDNLKNKYKNFIIKPSTDTGSGKNVRLISLNNLGVDLKTNMKIDNIIDLYGNNFIIQEIVKQDNRINLIYSNAINTLRVMTYILNDKIYVGPIVMRIGRGGSYVDNAHAGGIFIAVGDDGKIAREAYTEYQDRFIKHPDTGVVFENYQLPNIDILKNEIVKLHKKIPNIKIVSWDIAFNNKNKFSLIEVNLHSQAIWIQQMAHGKGFFEDNTSQILKDINCNKFYQRR